MVEMLKFNSRAEWLEARKNYIGGSEAAAIVGMSPYSNNVDLWELKTGRRVAEDISDNPLVKYGTEAEKYLRELFTLDHPQYAVNYVDNNLWLNDRYPWAHASLDGTLFEIETERRGVLEIKTTTIQNPAQKLKWDGRIPDNYYCQVLHYLMVTEFDFAVLKAQLKWDNGEDVFCVTKHYKIEREEVFEDIKFLENSEKEFFDYIKNDVRPPLVLPRV